MWSSEPKTVSLRLRVEVNKQRRAAAKTAGGYAHLGRVPAAPLHVHSRLPLNCGPVDTCEWTDMTALAFVVQLPLRCVCVCAVIASGAQVIRAGINGMSCFGKPQRAQRTVHSAV